MSNRPIVGITGFHGKWTFDHGADLFTGVERVYTDGIVIAGGMPILLMANLITLDDALDMVDALVLTGGADMDPAHYGHDRAPDTGDPDPERDSFEIELVRRAIERGLPILAICRGHQVINVALGGRLFQHVEGHEGTELPASGFHLIDIDPGTRLHGVLNKTQTSVNSLHHQAVAEPGDGLTVAARSSDGHIEATEHHERPLLTVQWHPERQTDSSIWWELLDWLISESRSLSSTRHNGQEVH